MTPPPDSASSVLETLRAKAKLLLRRERELFELRQARERTEAWLGAFTRLSPELQRVEARELIERWAMLLVGHLDFGVAGAVEYDAGGRVVSAYLDPGPAQAPSALDASTIAFFEGGTFGTYEGHEPSDLAPFAGAMDLDMFFWLCVPVLTGTHLVLFAGSAPRTAEYSRLRDYDRAHFVMLGNHLSAHLNNGTLAREIDRERTDLKQTNGELDASLRRLRETQEQLVQSTKLVVEASRRAGMADIATGALHNVGNVLNSINVSAEVVTERLRKSRVGAVAKVATLLDEQRASMGASFEPGSKCARAVSYLHELGAHLLAERDELVAESVRLGAQLAHVKSVISKQQAYAVAVDVSEPTDVTQLVDEALVLAQASLARHGVELAREYQPLPELHLDRHKTLQILVNLLNNAKQAVCDATTRPKRIVVGIHPVAGDRFHLTVTDNGVGVRDEHRPRMFTQGFTTKEGGHGFGLHTSALAAQELGGALTFASEGEGTGTTFTLELPLRASGAAERAK